MTETPTVVTSRRNLLRKAGAATLSAAGVAALAHVGAPRGALAGTMNAEADSQLLNTALSLEYEGIGAYDLAIGSTLLEAPYEATARLFQSHHEAHAEALANAVRTLGGTPVEPRPLDDYAVALNASALRNQDDIIALALRLERGAAEGYLGLLPSFEDREFSLLVARLAADETMHWTALTMASGKDLPKEALTFGS